MKKILYTKPCIKVLSSEIESFVCLSIPIGPGAGPGGGGQAKKWDVDLDEEEEDFAGYKAWEENGRSAD